MSSPGGKRVFDGRDNRELLGVDFCPYGESPSVECYEQPQVTKLITFENRNTHQGMLYFSSHNLLTCQGSDQCEVNENECAQTSIPLRTRITYFRRSATSASPRLKSRGPVDSTTLEQTE